jgi:hypothetical protein
MIMEARQRIYDFISADSVRRLKVSMQYSCAFCSFNETRKLLTGNDCISEIYCLAFCSFNEKEAFDLPQILKYWIT